MAATSRSQDEAHKLAERNLLHQLQETQAAEQEVKDAANDAFVGSRPCFALILSVGLSTLENKLKACSNAAIAFSLQHASNCHAKWIMSA